MIKRFQEVREAAKGQPLKKLAIVSAHAPHTVRSGLIAQEEGIAVPIFIGERETIETLLRNEGLDPKNFRIEAADCEEAAALRAVELARSGEAEILLKGNLSTSVLMKKVLNKEAGLRTGHLLSDILLAEVKVDGKVKLIGVTDGGVNILPSVEEKRVIILNAAKVYQRLGHSNPRVAVLSCIEYINEKIHSTVDGAELQRLNREGNIPGCVVQGPLALDLAVSKAAGELKGIQDEGIGEADILLVPSIEAGNILGKSFTYFSGVQVGHIVVGAQVPVLIPSRAETEEDRLNSIALGSVVGRVFD